MMVIPYLGIIMGVTPEQVTFMMGLRKTESSATEIYEKYCADVQGARACGGPGLLGPRCVPYQGRAPGAAVSRWRGVACARGWLVGCMRPPACLPAGLPDRIERHAA